MLKLTLLLLLVPFSLFAQLEQNSLFRTQGKKVLTKISMQNYVATRELLYYIPKKIDMRTPTTVVIYLHGGNSNMTQERARDTADMLFWSKIDGPLTRAEGMKSIADKYGFIVVLPTTTTGWNDHTPFYMRELLAVIRKELNPDPNRIFLTGHSMGAMGICRSVSALADEFAMFIPFSGGFQPHLRNTEFIGSLYNTKVFIASGKNYEFPEFISWNESFEKFITNDYVQNHFNAGMPDWQFDIHPGTHNPNIPYMTYKFADFMKVERNLFRANLFGSFFQGRSVPGYIIKNESLRYFWAEGKMRELDAQETALGISFRLYSANNVIDIYIDRPITLKFDTRAHLRQMRLHLSEKLFNLDSPIRVNLITKRGSLNEESVLFEGMVNRDRSASEALMMTSGDKGLMFDAFLDLVLPRN